jgi:hypothetical protein
LKGFDRTRGAEVGPWAQAGGRRLAAADQVQLVVEDEQVLRRGSLRVRRRLVQLIWADVKESAVNVVHGEQRGRRATGAGQELPPADAEFSARLVHEFAHPRFDPFLLVGLRDRHVLAVGDHARRYRRARLGRVRALAFGHLFLVEESVVFFPVAARFVPLFDSHGFSLLL